MDGDPVIHRDVIHPTFSLPPVVFLVYDLDPSEGRIEHNPVLTMYDDRDHLGNKVRYSRYLSVELYFTHV